ncbi:MAG TPA: GGDEF domain-containing protein, partial [Gaiellaceae bacterium]
RSGLQVLVALLVVAGILVIATVRILDANALQNERAHADAALTRELQSASDELRTLSDNAASTIDDLGGSARLQRAFFTNDRAAIERLARHTPNTVFYSHGHRVAGTMPPVALTRATSLVLNGSVVGQVVATIGIDRPLMARLLAASQHGPHDRLIAVQGGRVPGSSELLRVSGRTILLDGVRYRGWLVPVPNAPRTNLVALRPEAAISAAVRPYQQRILYTALGSFALLVLLALFFGGPILRMLGDFRRVASQATTDSMTGLANRWTFDEELALEWRRAERVGDPLALILLDVDDFKSINDRHGHQAGDEVLRRVGEVLAGSVRHVDLAARYGGEEFAVIVPDTDLDGAVDLAERLRKGLAGAKIELPDGTQLSLTASFGAAVKGDLPGGEKLVAAADKQLYVAKHGGKNRVAPEPTRNRPAASKAVERRRHPSSDKR